MDATSIVVRGKARKIPRTNALQQLYRSMHTDLIPSSKCCCMDLISFRSDSKIWSMLSPRSKSLVPTSSNTKSAFDWLQVASVRF
jgi:hypothetical protein